ncbi:photosystem II manganese-stabilizing polypeptide [Roseofilum casamattae]|uniref:Photosystem II extrinsic protein O n=1 Tax=Roseofilum casamattae BLCC-M143 TaxID=3022442 RepID=A0ABT7C0E7_9CYAN|nr:photosystem II manganese-stabilizing polypeptide [Roseofilum casamattae]MDJ1184219.1 photosystem II manganese-stabilizing polypeptide [Roseofilum casamattae BLCC-M143]
MKYRAFISLILVLCLSLITACSGGPAGENLTYDDIKNTGLANNCPQLEEASRGSIALDRSKNYVIDALCLQPNDYFVKEEPTSKRKEAEFVRGRVLTRYTSSLTDVFGDLTFGPDKSLVFSEKGGIDFQIITVLLPGGEEVPFFFTIKDLVATSQPGADSVNTSTDLSGSFRVPSYRGATFLDPKARGVATGYDNAVAVPSSADNEEFTLANVKRVQVGEGEISLQVTKVDPSTGEIGGIFTSIQPSDTDLGAKEAADVKIKGLFYARVEEDLSES